MRWDITVWQPTHVAVFREGDLEVTWEEGDLAGIGTATVDGQNVIVARTGVPGIVLAMRPVEGSGDSEG